MKIRRIGNFYFMLNKHLLKSRYNTLLVLFLAYTCYFFCVSFTHAQTDSISTQEIEKNRELKKKEKEVENLILKAQNAKSSKKVELLLDISNFYRRELRNSKKALEYTTLAVKEAITIRDNYWIAKTSIQAGVIHRNQGESDFALTLLLRGASIAEELGNDSLQTDAIHKVAVTYLLMRDYEQSYTYSLKEEELWRELDSDYGLASALNLKGISLIYLKRYDEAIAPLEQGVVIAERLENEDLMYKLFFNLADVYLKKEELGKAMSYIMKSSEITQRTNDNYGNLVNMIKLGEIYAAKGDISKAINTTEEGVALAQKYRYAALVRNGREALRDIYFKAADYKKAFENQEIATLMNDSLSNISRKHQVANMQTYYEAERKEKENQLLKEESKNKTLTVYLASAIALIALLLVGLFIYRTQLKKKTITKLRSQNDEIRTLYEQMSKQSALIENHNIMLKESINYARRIQNAIQVNTTSIFKELNDYFLIDRPRDIVSGDCYWFEQREEDFYVALADCTGHGIPGAFMSILCNSLLRDIFTSKTGVCSPADMLIELHNRLLQHLHKQETNIQDGMDIAICRINTTEKTITYSGAKQPMLYVDKDGAFNRFKPSSLPIGGHEVRIKRKYEDLTIYYQIGDTVYFSSDGYQDQFGGKNDKKFMTKRLYKMLTQIYKMPLEKQKTHIEKQLEKWQAGNRQTDDIMMIGIRLN